MGDIAYVVVWMLALVVGCGQRDGHPTVTPAAMGAGPLTSAVTGAASRANGGATGWTVAPVAPDERLPVVFVHGTNGQPADWAPVLRNLARGRLVLPELYADDSDALSSGSLPADSLFAFGYYRDSRTSPLYYTDRHPEGSSIGGCPVPRSDPLAARYTISFAQQLDRAVENICRATGVERVDLVGFSMGGLVVRAYARWHSLKGPGGRSRVRRLLTVSTPNHGINSLEATLYARAQGGVREHARQGEGAELNYEARFWGGRSFIEHLNDGWDAFCVRHDIVYAGARGFGNAFQHQQAVRGLAQVLGSVLPAQTAGLLAHPTPGFDLRRELTEATEDGDGTVRTASAYFDPAVYPHVRFNAAYYGTHDDAAHPERSLKESAFTEALVRRFIFEGRDHGGFQATATMQAVNAGHEATWLLLDIDVTGGTPLVATVYTRSPLAQLAQPVTAPFGLGSEAYSLLLRTGRQQLVLDPNRSDGKVDVELRLYGLDGVVALPTRPVRMDRGGLVPVQSPLPTLGQPQVQVGGIRLPLRSALTSAEFAFCLAGITADWSGFHADSEILLPNLAPGDYELRLRARAPAAASGHWIEEARPAALQLRVNPSGGISVRR